jgi:predicted RNA-binding protein Jag
MSEKTDDSFEKYPKQIQEQIERNKQALGIEDKPEAKAEGEAQAKPPAPPAPAIDQQSDQPEQKRPDPGDHDWEKRYKNYKQSTDSTIHELRQVNSQMEQQLNSMAQAMQQMQQHLQRQPQPQNAKDLPQDLKAKLQELYGEEDLDAMQKLAQHVASRELAQRDQVILDLKRRLDMLSQESQHRQQYVKQQAEQQVLMTVEERLDQAASGWRKIDNDQAFLQWMQGRDPNSLSGKSRSDMMASAYKNGSLADVARHYRDYMNERGMNEGPRTDPRLASTPRSNPASEPTGKPAMRNITAPGTFQEMVRKKLRKEISEDEFKAFEQQYMKALTGRAA